MSAATMPLTSWSAAAVHEDGSRVAVWKPPPFTNWKVPPWAIVALRGKKSLNAQLWPAGTAAASIRRDREPASPGRGGGHAARREQEPCDECDRWDELERSPYVGPASAAHG